MAYSTINSEEKDGDQNIEQGGALMEAFEKANPKEFVKPVVVKKPEVKKPVILKKVDDTIDGNKIPDKINLPSLDDDS